MSVLLYGSTTRTLTKRLEEKLDGNYTRMLWAVLKKSWKQHPTKHQVNGQLLLISQSIQRRQAVPAGYCWRNKDKIISNVFLSTLSTHGSVSVGCTAKSYIQQLCVDTGCRQENLQRAMGNRYWWWERERERERVRGICAVDMCWLGLFYGISTLVGYLMPNLGYTYILKIYDWV